MTRKLNTILFVGFLIAELITIGIDPPTGMILIAFIFWIRMDVFDDEAQSACHDRVHLVRLVHGRLEYLTRSRDQSLVELPECKDTSFTLLEAAKIDPKHEYIWEKEFTQ